MKKIKAPFGWVGGKSKLADEIIEKFPKHELYVEVFGGALNVFYAKSPSPREVVNDINSELVNLHRCIRTNPRSLHDHLNRMIISRKIFDDIRDSKIKPSNNIERAAHYFFLLSQSFGSKGTNFAMSAKSGRPPKNIYRWWGVWSKRLKYVTIENKSFENLIVEYDQKEAFFYCDPPYVDTESYYQHTGGFGLKEHELLADTLKKIKGRFFLSYNDCELVRELYKDFKIEESKEIDYLLGRGAHKQEKKVREVYITNYEEERNTLF